MRLLAMRSVLVATDLSEGSTAALRTATSLARLTEARLTILHVKEGSKAADRTASEWVNTQAGPVDESTQVRTVPGDASKSIAEHADRLDADVIVLGPHRQERRTGRLGSTADRVVRSVSRPCLVVPREMSLPMSRVMVCVDFSEAACGALLVGLSWAAALRQPSRESRTAATEVRVMHVTADDRERPSAQETLHQQVEAIHSRIPGVPGIVIREMLEQGADPAQVILDDLEKGDIDLTVLSTHGIGRRESELLGSVSSAVVRQSSGPILLVPPEVWRKQVELFAA